jgi:hypothetical protein
MKLIGWKGNKMRPLEELRQYLTNNNLQNKYKIIEVTFGDRYYKDGILNKCNSCGYRLADNE